MYGRGVAWTTITERFCSLQGEGLLVGVPSVFLRTTGCNLRCAWCDTPYSSWDPRGERTELAELLDYVAACAPVRHVVVTGGEPMIARDVGPLTQALRAAGYHVTIETAATVWDDAVEADLWSISPKLSGSTPDNPVWGPRHEARRLAPDVIRAMMAAGPWQLKLVVGDPAELLEVDALVREVGADADRARVLLMPEGRDVARLDEVMAWLGPACIERGYRLCDRLQIRLYGDTPGT